MAGSVYFSVAYLIATKASPISISIAERGKNDDVINLKSLNHLQENSKFISRKAFTSDEDATNLEYLKSSISDTSIDVLKITKKNVYELSHKTKIIFFCE